MSEPRRLRTACNRDCPDACEIIATVEDGRVTRIQGNRDHPVTRGFLCFRTNRFLRRQYDPERITTPLVRRGLLRGGADAAAAAAHAPRAPESPLLLANDADFEPASWEEVLDFLAASMLRIRRESGPAAILHYRSGGTLGLMKHVSDTFFERFGPVTIKSGDICSGAGDEAQVTDFGREEAHDLFDLLNSRVILLWGKNPYISSVHLLPVLREAKERGARLALIDPVAHKTADLCQLVLQPRPGGDIALALGVARWLFENGKTDPAAADYCDHLEEFRALAFGRTPAEWAALADVSEHEVVELAALYADGPSALLVGWGMQRKANGSATVRVMDALTAISGNLGVPGGGVSFSTVRRAAFDLSFSRGLEIAPRAIPEPLLGPGILAASDPEVRMVWVTAGNPVAMLPESETVARALVSRELTVVVDSFLTDTARCAHVVLPTTTMLEDDDLIGSYGHHWLAEVRPVIAAPPEVRTDYAIVRELAPRVGLNGEFTADVETWKRRMLARVAPKGASLEAMRDGPVRNPEMPKVLFADRRFPTASGRVNLLRQVDPEPARPTPDRPLLLMAVSSEKGQSSQWSARPPDGPAEAVLHPAAAPEFQDGEVAVVTSEVASIEVKLRFDGRQRRDVLLMEKGGWYRTGRCANALVPARLTDAGGGAVYFDTPVRLKKKAP